MPTTGSAEHQQSSFLFNPGLTSTQIITSVKAVFSEVTDHDAYVEVLHQIDDTLHEITEHHDLSTTPDIDSTKKHETHERAGHLPKDPACPSCIRESGSTILHYKGQKPHYGTLYMDIGQINQPNFYGRVFYLVLGLRVKLTKISPSLQLQMPSSRIIFSDGEHVFDNPLFKKRALDLGIGACKSPPYQPQSDGIAERLTHAADLLRHRALKVQYPHPAFGEIVGVWTSQDKNKTKALDPKGSIGGYFILLIIPRIAYQFV
eukprot:832863-Amphidinium_carterae.1